MNIIAGTATDVTLIVAKLDGSAFVSAGTIYVRLYDPGTDKFWSADGGGQWEAEGDIATWPTATHKGHGGWNFQIPAAATTSLTEPTELYIWYDDNDAEASVTSVSVEALITVRAADLATETDTVHDTVPGTAHEY